MKKIIKINGDPWLCAYNLYNQGKPTPDTYIDDEAVTWDKIFKISFESRALSIRQPWAWAIVNGYKPVENRDWNYEPNYRGSLLIHASKTFDYEGYAYLDHYMDSLEYAPRPKDFRTGGIVGVANMTGVVNEHESDWFTGPMGFVLENAVPVKFIPYKGQLNFFSVPARTILELEVKNNQEHGS